MRLPSYPRTGDDVAGKIREIIDFMRAIRITSVVGGLVQETANGTGLVFKPGGAGGTTAAGPCYFGEIISIPNTDPVQTGIRGGLILCGDQNWNMDPLPLNLTVAGEWLVYHEVSVEVNRDDDATVLLPGVKTGTRPSSTWDKTAWSPGTDYPDNTLPNVTTGNGEIILPLGKLTIADGVATFDPTGCGHFEITHCAGTLGYTRT